MAPGVVASSHSRSETVDLTGGSKPAEAAMPSSRVSNAGPAVALSAGLPGSPALAAASAALNGAAGASASPSGVAALHTRLAERVERARDTIMDTELYGTLSSVSARVSAKLHAVWEFSKKASWIVGTSALVLVVPLLYEMDKELVGNETAVGADAVGSSAPAASADSGAAASPDGATLKSAPAPAT